MFYIFLKSINKYIYIYIYIYIYPALVFMYFLTIIFLCFFMTTCIDVNFLVTGKGKQGFYFALKYLYIYGIKGGDFTAPTLPFSNPLILS